MSNPVSMFADIVARQFNFLNQLRAIDDHYRDSPMSDFGHREDGRRGWTRHDVTARQALEAEAGCRLPSFFINSVRLRSQCRVATAYRMFGFFDQCNLGRKAAILFCRDHAEFAIDEPAIIHRMARLHNDWLGHTRHHDDGAAVAVEHEWRVSYSELLAVCRAIESAGWNDNLTAPAIPQAITKIPPEFRSKPIAKKIAAKLLGRGCEDSGVKWLNDCITDGTIACEGLSRQSFVFDIRQFPESVHPRLLPPKSC